MNHIEYVLAHLKINSLGKPGSMSEYADSILEFWALGPEHKFSINARVFKPSMEADLPKYIDRVISRATTQSDAEVKSKHEPTAMGFRCKCGRDWPCTVAEPTTTPDASAKDDCNG